MLLHQAGEEITGAKIAKFFLARGEVLAQMLRDRFMVGEQRRQHPLRVEFLVWLFRQVGQLQEFFQRAGGHSVQCANSLGDIVDDVAQRLVLRLEELVQFAELGPGHIPVKAARLGVEHEFVAQQCIQDGNRTAPLFVVQSDVDAHVDLL